MKLVKLVIFLFLFIFPIFTVSKVSAIDQFFTQADWQLGQPDFDSNLPREIGLWNPQFISEGAGKIYISNFTYCQILGFSSAPSINAQAFDFVIGQPKIQLSCINKTTPSQTSISEAGGTASDGTKFALADWGNNRILIYNSLPSANGATPDVVLGQPDFNTKVINNGGVSMSSLYYPFTVYINGGKLFVADTYNHRVLIWNTIPTVSNTPADVVLGQPDSTSNSANNGGINVGMSSPTGVFVLGGKLFVTDTNNHRVLVWNTVPTTSSDDPDFAIGQPDLLSNASNNGGLSAHSLSTPSMVGGSGSKLAITDSANNRVLIYNSIPNSNVDADVVIGQPDMVSNAVNNGGISGSSLRNPSDVKVFGGKLYIADKTNNRVLVWDSIPTSNFSSANLVIGQGTFTSASAANGGNNVFSYPQITYEEGKYIVSDMNNNRILFWNSKPTQSYPVNPDFILGQPDISSKNPDYGGSVSGHGFNFQRRARICGGKLVVPDYNNNRVLIWTTFPSASNDDADIVLGQPDLTSNSQNNGGLSASSLRLPNSVACDGTKLLVTDYANRRILIWNTFPTANKQAADLVLGQPDFVTSSLSNQWDLGKGFGYSSVEYKNNMIFVTDFSNSRVLIWNTFPTSNFQAADVVVGQPDFTTNIVNNGGISSKTLNLPRGLTIADGKMFIADTYNNRVLGWSTIPTSNFAPADIVLGQPNFTSNQENISNKQLYNPESVVLDSDSIYIADQGNNRILSFNTGPQNLSVQAPSVVSSNVVEIDTTATGAKQMIVSENPSLAGASWEPYTNSKLVTLSSGDGTKVVYVKFSDYAGYESQVLSVSVKVDTTSPKGAITIISDTNNDYTNTVNVSLSLNGEDSVTNVKYMKVSNDSNFSNVKWIPYTQTMDWILTDGDGLKDVFVIYKDSLGNVSTVYKDSIILDTTNTLEIIKINGNSPQDTNPEEVTTAPKIEGTSQPNSNITVEVYFDNNKYIEEEFVANNDGNWTWETEQELKLGENTIKIISVDSAGNKVEQTITINMKDSIIKEIVQNVQETFNTKEGKVETKAKWVGLVQCLIPLILILLLIVAYQKYREKEQKKN